MNKLVVLLLSLAACGTSGAQTLSLDSCKARAVRSNKQMGMAKVKMEIAKNTRKAARTKYLPHIDVAGGYMYSSREISLLSDDQKTAIGNLGTEFVQTVAGQMPDLKTGITNAVTSMVQQGALSPAEAQKIQGMMQNAGTLGQKLAQELAADGNAIGQQIVDAFRTNTHHLFTASAMFTQPVFMGGAIVAGNKMADIAEKMAGTNIVSKERDILYKVENAYWTVVSLRQKQKLAADYLALVQKLDDDVHKMIKEGVATRADGLKVDVAVNEAEMTKTKVDNGLSLARMYLNQVCGMPLDDNTELEDENSSDLEATTATQYQEEGAYERRPELQLLNQTIDLSKQQTKVVRAAYLPQVAVTGGVLFSNPSVYNGFERKFKGAFNVGIMVRIPVLDWGDTMYKIRASKCATTMAQLAYDEAHEMIELQINQSNFKVREAAKNLESAKKNIERAEENLRCANIGFKEGVMQTTDVMAAQTAWMQAHSNKVDAVIDVKMSESALKKALGYE